MSLLEVLELANGFDHLVLTRFRQVATIYDKMARDYASRQYDKILAHRATIFSPKELQVMENAERLEIGRNTLIERARHSPDVYSAELLWKEVVSDHEGSWEFEVYSGKK
jgi:hypothetical protein